MFITPETVQQVLKIAEPGIITSVDKERYLVSVRTDSGRIYTEVPFIYTYLFSSTVTKNGLMRVHNKDSGTVSDVDNESAMNYGEGVLYMPQGGERVAILYILMKPYILGYILENSPGTGNRYNKPPLEGGEYRIQSRSGAYIHIRQNKSLELFASPLCQIILTELENTMKMFLENAAWYFNVGYIFFQTDTEKDETLYTFYMRPKRGTGDAEEDKTYYRLDIGTNKEDKEQFVRLKIVCEQETKLTMDIDYFGNIKFFTKGSIDATVEGNVKALVKGKVEAEIDKTLDVLVKENITIHGQQDIRVTADGVMYLVGHPIHENR